MIIDIKAVKNSYLFETKLNKGVVELARLKERLLIKWIQNKQTTKHFDHASSS